MKPVIGPYGASAERFESWFKSENFTDLSTHEVASLAFDAGHAFHHEDLDALQTKIATLENELNILRAARML